MRALISISFILLGSREALADQPTAYRCGAAGVADGAARTCRCPAAQIARRGGDGIMRCVDRPPVAPPKSARAPVPEPMPAPAPPPPTDVPPPEEPRDPGVPEEDTTPTDLELDLVMPVPAPRRNASVPIIPHAGLSPHRKAAIALGSAAAVSLVTAAALEIGARGGYDPDGLVRGTDEEAAAYRRANRLHLGAQLTVGAGAALGVAAVYFWYRDRGSTSPRPVPTVGDGVVGLAIAGDI